MNKAYYFNITYKCNNRCKNCISYSTRHHLNLDIDVNDIDAAIKKFNISIDDRWIINGGEPTLSPYFVQIIEKCWQYSHHIVLYTNGRLLKKFPSNVIDKIERIIVPLYGSSADHDAYTNVNGSWMETVNNLINIIRYNNDKLDIKLIIGKDFKRFSSLFANKKWEEISMNKRFSITRVLPDFKSISKPTDNLTKYAEELITKLLAQHKIVRFYDYPYCQFTERFQTYLEKIYTPELNNFFKITCCWKNKNYSYENWNNTHFYDEKCKMCSKNHFCAMIMRNYHCIEIYNDKCWISTE